MFAIGKTLPGFALPTTLHLLIASRRSLLESATLLVSRIL
jgi:hypothetical protein